MTSNLGGTSPASISVLRTQRQTTTPVHRVAMLDTLDASTLGAALGDRPALVAVSPTVHQLFGDALEAHVGSLEPGQAEMCVVPTGELNKNLRTVEWLVARAHLAGLPRDGVIVGVGGGVLLDIVGLAANLYRRGVPHFKVGTTLVAQVDAAVGLKCGVNSSGGKNLAGTFFPPELVLTDGSFLCTLGQRETRCGVAEMVKLAVACDDELFRLLTTYGHLLREPELRNEPEAQSMVDRSIRGMIDQLNANPYERSLQRVVDLGHTISGTIEVATNHDVAHGEAVALDLAFFCAASTLLGRMEERVQDDILSLLQDFGLAVWHPVMSDQRLITAALKASAAHRGRNLNLPLPVGIGECDFLQSGGHLTANLLADAAEICRAREAKLVAEAVDCARG